MAMRWSEKQLQAIYESGKNILVNAGAGSGKTAVLTQRLLEKIKSGVSLKNLIVLTFTKLAASEMKERLRKNLTKELNNVCGDTLKHLQDELSYIDQANIQTFDAFSGDIVKKYHYLLNIPANINLIDDASFNMEKTKILDKIFDEEYLYLQDDFKNFICDYSIKDDKYIKKEIIGLYDVIVQNNDLEFLDNYEVIYQKPYLDMLKTDYFKALNDYKLTSIDYYKRLEQYTTDPDLKKNYDKTKKYIDKLSSAKSYSDYWDVVWMSLSDGVKSAEDEEEMASYNNIFKMLKKEKEDAKNLMFFENDKSYELNHLCTKSNVGVIVRILKKLHQNLEKYKKSINAYTFNDIQLMAINIIENNSDVRLDYKNNINEILVDEYQDTSDSQERLINLIENDNVYMVGDVKQAIYGFRGANPDLFISKYNYLSNPNNKGMVIDLSQNFRSRSEVLSGVNDIFDKVMSEGVGGVNYDDSHTLKYGLKAYDDNSNADYKMKYLGYFSDSDKYSDFSSCEIEAFLIAKDILGKMNVRDVYDKDLGSLRKVKYSDFAILVATKSNFDTYKKIFEYFNIPLAIYKSSSFAENSEIYAINNLLRVIYSFKDKEFSKEYFKVSLTGMLRSFIFDISDEQISNLFIQTSTVKKEFKKQLPEIYNKINAISKNVDNMSLVQIVDRIFKDFRLYEKVCNLTETQSSERRLNHFRSIISNFEKMNYSLVDTIEYFNNLIDEGSKYQVELDEVIPTNINAVKMMTIHASKGLEFPICYFSDNDKKFRFSSASGFFNYDKKYKIFISSVHNKIIYNNPINLLYKLNSTRCEVSEKIRLLYVALTRPREEVIIVGSALSEDATNNSKVSDEAKNRYKSYLSLYNSINKTLDKYVTFVNVNSLSLTHDYELNKKRKGFDGDEEFNFDFSGVKLQKKAIKKHIASSDKHLLKTKSELELLEVGEKFHKKLEMVDFKNPGGITDNYIDKFLNSEFIKSLNILETYHEMQYTYIERGLKVNGIIDLVIETDNEVIVIDYKLSNIDSDGYVKQVNEYKKYLSRVCDKTVKGYLYSIIKGYFKEV